MSVTAIVPLKALDRSKGRLAGRLSTEERRRLTAGLFTHVVGVCRALADVAEVRAVVGDDAGAMLARDAGAVPVREDGPGLNAAIRRAAAGIDTDASLVVVADLPHLGARDLAAVVAAGRRGPCVVVAGTSDGGTGALLRRPADVIPPAFGPASAAAHLDAAQRAGVTAVRVSAPGLAHDVDRPGDLRHVAGVRDGDPRPD